MEKNVESETGTAWTWIKVIYWILVLSAAGFFYWLIFSTLF